MFHLQSLELLQWDYCQRLTLPLDEIGRAHV